MARLGIHFVMFKTTPLTRSLSRGSGEGTPGGGELGEEGTILPEPGVNALIGVNVVT